MAANAANAATVGNRKAKGAGKAKVAQAPASAVDSEVAKRVVHGADGDDVGYHSDGSGSSGVSIASDVVEEMMKRGPPSDSEDSDSGGFHSSASFFPIKTMRERACSPCHTQQSKIGGTPHTPRPTPHSVTTAPSQLFNVYPITA